MLYWAPSFPERTIFLYLTKTQDSQDYDNLRIMIFAWFVSEIIYILFEVDSFYRKRLLMCI